MNGRKAKRIRRQVYGKGTHPGPVRYSRTTKGTVVADQPRQAYQRAKRG